MPAITEDSADDGACTVKRRGRPRRQYKCSYCAKTFKRSEHCIRHERTHTNERPFICRYCSKSYSRKDLVTRHERTLHASPGQAGTGTTSDAANNAQIEQTEITIDLSMSQAAIGSLETPPSDNGQSIDDGCTSGHAGEDSSSSPSSYMDSRSHPVTDDYANIMIMDLGVGPSPTYIVDIGSGSMVSEPSTSNSSSSDPNQAVKSSVVLSDSTSQQLHTLLAQTARSGQDIDSNIDPFLDLGFSPSQATKGVRQSEAFRTDANSTDQIRQRHQKHQHQRQPSHQYQHQVHPFQPHQQHVVTTGDVERSRPSMFSPSTVGDIDLAAFSFSPVSGHLIDLNQSDSRSLLQTTDSFDLQGTLSEELGQFQQLTPRAPPSQQLSSIPPATWDSQKRCSPITDAFKPSQNGLADLPILLRDGPRSFPTFTVCDKVHALIKLDLAQRLQLGQSREDDLPSPRMCEDFLTSYMNNFHGHFPIIHLPTFSPGKEPSPLLLVMCSIGALYRLDRRRARRLNQMVRKAIEDSNPPFIEEQQQSLVKGYPLWYVQTRALLSFYAIMSGDKDLISSAIQENGMYTLIYQKARASVREYQGDTARLGWQTWAHVESWKRLLGAMLICSTLTMVMFDVNPGVNTTMDLDFDIFHDERLWNARSSVEWRELQAHIGGPEKFGGPYNMKEILTAIMQRGKPGAPVGVYQVSAYTALILMHAVVIHMWQRAQVSQTLAADLDVITPSSATLTQESLGNDLISRGLVALSRCQSFLDGARNSVRSGSVSTAGNSAGSSGGSPEEDEKEIEVSLVFNSHALLRIAYVRLFKGNRPGNSIDLANLHDTGIDAATVAFVSNKMERSPQMLEAVAKALDGLRAPVKMGHLFVRKTAAFRWSVEQAVAGWDCALLVSKWVHAVEMDRLGGNPPTADENDIFTAIKEILEEAECEVEDGSSLAAAVARTWSWFLRDVWVWGITPMMGTALVQVADTYSRVFESNGRLLDARY